MLADFSKHLAALSAFLLALSVVYDYAYVHAIGLSFAQIPTTLADHVRSAVIWSPGIALFALFGLIAGLGTPPMSIAERWNHPMHRAVDLVMFLGALPLLVVIGFVSPPELTAIAASLIVAMLILRFQPGAGNIETKLGQGTAPFLFVVPATLALVALAGWSHGTLLVSTGAQVAEVVVKQEGGERTLNATGLRRFSAASIVVAADGVHVLPAESIVRVLHPKPSRVSVACMLTSRMCPATK